MRASVAVVLVSLFLTWSARPAAAAPILSIVPSTSTVDVGQFFSVDINITDVTDLYGFGFDLNFDDTLLDPVGTIAEGTFLSTVGTPLPPVGTTRPTQYVPGFYTPQGLIEFTLGFLDGLVPGVNGSGTLATMTFLAQAPGTSFFFLTNWVLQDSTVPGNIIDPTGVFGASVQINPVIPEPATLLLLGTGLTLAIRRRSKGARH